MTLGEKYDLLQNALLEIAYLRNKASANPGPHMLSHAQALEKACVIAQTALAKA